MEQLFTGKTAVVTGAASGIGRATALLYARHGANVIVSDISEEAGRDAVHEIKKSGGEAAFARADVSDPSDCEKLIQKAVKTYGGLDIACNNAGISGEANCIAAMNLAEWKKVIDINLNGVFYCLKYEIKAMLERGGGAIVNTGSILGAVGFATMGAYVAAKHAVVGLTQTAALEYAAKGIRVNAVAPGFIDTALLGGVHQRVKHSLAQMHPVGRMGQPEEVAELIIWLSSSKAAYANGSCYPMDGGYLAR